MKNIYCSYKIDWNKNNVMGKQCSILLEIWKICCASVWLKWIVLVVRPDCMIYVSFQSLFLCEVPEWFCSILVFMCDAINTY